MKKNKKLLIISCIFLLSGCSNIDIYLKNVPFLHKEKNDEKIVENRKNRNLQKQLSTNPLTLEAVYFNDIKQVNGKNIIQNPSNILALVNKSYILPDRYIPEDLVRPKVAFSFGEQNLEKSYLRKDAGQALEKMFASAKDLGIELYAVSGYRSFIRQKALLDAEIHNVGEEKAIQAVAVPGSSEHQTGLAMDIGAKSTNFYLSEGFANTKEGIWLAENAHRFGFILRYPKGKEAITNYEYEPWHFRYVGVKAAEIIYKNKWTLEEYFNEVKKI